MNTAGFSRGVLAVHMGKLWQTEVNLYLAIVYRENMCNTQWRRTTVEIRGAEGVGYGHGFTFLLRKRTVPL